MEYETFIEIYFKEQFGLTLRKIPEHPSGKSPDFECIEDGLCIFVAELKTITDHLPSEATRWTMTQHSDVEMSAVRDDNSPNRVANLIEKAHMQLRTRTEPKLVILLNDAGLDILDLKEAIDGYLDYRNQSTKILRNTKSAYIAKRLQPTLAELDAIIWMEKRSSRYHYLFNSERGMQIGFSYFSNEGSQ